MRAVGVVRSAALVGGDDVGITLLVVLCKTVSRRLSGRSFEVVKIAVLLLINDQTLAHVVEYVLRELLHAHVGKVGAQPLGVEPRLVHTDKPDGCRTCRGICACTGKAPRS